MSSGDNWTKEETQKELKKKAHRVLEEVKERRSAKNYRLVKVCDHPLTIKEVEIKENEK